MIAEKLKRIRELKSKSTASPWSMHEYGYGRTDDTLIKSMRSKMGKTDDVIGIESTGTPSPREGETDYVIALEVDRWDAELIVEVVNNVDALLDHIDLLEAKLEVAIAKSVHDDARSALQSAEQSHTMPPSDQMKELYKSENAAACAVVVAIGRLRVIESK